MDKPRPQCTKGHVRVSLSVLNFLLTENKSLFLKRERSALFPGLTRSKNKQTCFPPRHTHTRTCPSNLPPQSYLLLRPRDPPAWGLAGPFLASNLASASRSWASSCHRSCLGFQNRAKRAGSGAGSPRTGSWRPEGRSGLPLGPPQGAEPLTPRRTGWGAGWGPRLP